MITTNHKIPKFNLGLSIIDIALQKNHKLTKPLLCQIKYNKNRSCIFKVEKSKSRIDQMPILSYRDKIQIIIIQEDDQDQIGSITFNAKLFNNCKGKIIKKWITLFDLPDDDEYDGDLEDDDEEIPKVYLGFYIDMPNKVDMNIKAQINKYESMIPIIPEIKEETSPPNKANFSFSQDSERADQSLKINKNSLPNSVNQNIESIIEEQIPDSILANIERNSSKNDKDTENIQLNTGNESINNDNSIGVNTNANEIKMIKLCGSNSSSNLNALIPKENQIHVSIEGTHQENRLMTNTKNDDEGYNLAGDISDFNHISNNNDNEHIDTTNLKRIFPNKHDNSVVNCKKVMAEQQIWDMNPLINFKHECECEKKLLALRLEAEQAKEMETKYAKLEEKERKLKEQLSQSIEQIKQLSNENLELKQNLYNQQNDNTQISIPKQTYDDLKQQHDNYVRLYKLETEQANEATLKCQKYADDIKNLNKSYHENLKFTEEKKSILEDTINTLRSDNQKLLFKLTTIETELNSKILINQNQMKELEEYKKNMKLLTEKFDEYNQIKELDIKSIKEELMMTKMKLQDYEEIKKEKDSLKLELEKIQEGKLEEEKKRIMVVEEHNTKMIELGHKIKEIVDQFQDQTLQYDKLKNENSTLKLKLEETKTISFQNHDLQEKFDQLKAENSKLRAALTLSQEKLCLIATELVKHTTITINQNQIISQLNQTIKILDGADDDDAPSKKIPKNNHRFHDINTKHRSSLGSHMHSSSRKNNIGLELELDQLAYNNNNHRKSENSLELNRTPSSRSATNQQSIKNNQQLFCDTSCSSITSPVIKHDRASFDSTSQSSIYFDPIELKIHECALKANIATNANTPIQPIKIADGLYKLGTKQFAIVLIHDIPYVKVLGGYITLEDFLSYYSHLEVNNMKKIKGNQIEYSDMSQEAVPTEISNLVFSNEELMMLNFNNNNNVRLVNRIKHSSQSPISNSKAYLSANLIKNSCNNNNNNNGNNNKKLHIEISKSNEGYTVKNKIQLKPAHNNFSKYHQVGTNNNNTNTPPTTTTIANIISSAKYHPIIQNKLYNLQSSGSKQKLYGHYIENNEGEGYNTVRNKKEINEQSNTYKKRTGSTEKIMNFKYGLNKY